MTYNLLVHRKALDFYNKQDKKLQKRLKIALKELSQDPYNP